MVWEGTGRPRPLPDRGGRDWDTDMPRKTADTLARPSVLPMSRSDLRMLARCPARRAGSARQGRSPVRARLGVAERSGAALI